MKNKYTIFITSNESWGPIWFSKQHYANELSKLGHEVFFLNAPKNWQISNLFSIKLISETIQSNLTILDYKNNFPIRLFPNLFLKINDYLNGYKISKIKMKNEKVIWWQFDPNRFMNIHFVNTSRRIYHVTDPFTHIKSDSILAKEVDLVVLLLERYNDYYKKLNNNLINIPHGVSDNEFITDANLVNTISIEYPNSIVYIGTINDHYDLNLFNSIAINFPSNTFLLIGPNVLEQETNIKLFEKLLEFPNVIWIPGIPGNQIKNYVKSALVCVAPYILNVENQRGSSIKTINYLAQKKVIITAVKTGYEDLLNQGVYFARTENEFIQLIKDGLNNNLLFNEILVNDYLNSIKYSSLINRIIKKFE